MSENTDDLYYEDDELFDMFDSEHTKEVILNLYENEILKKFGIKNLGYNRYKDCTFDLLEDIIYLSDELGYNPYTPFLKSRNMEELKKSKYEMLEEYYKDVSDERYNFPERVEEVIKALKENVPDILIIDNERKKKIEEHYQHCDITVQLLRENHEKLFSYKINLESFNLKARRTEHLYQLMPKICAIAGCFVR